jgi:hypothetical protein
MSEGMKRERVTWEPVAAAACFASSALSIAGGFVFTTGWLLNADLHPLLHGIGLVLLIVGIPMLILGGHFMDLKEKKIQR